MEPVWIAIGGFVLAVIVQIVTAVWILRGLETSLVLRIQATKDQIDLTISNAVRERDQEITAIRDVAGEIGHSLREKINKVELYVEKEFLSKDDFKMHLELIRDQLSAMNSRFDSKFTAFEAKLDTLLARRDV